MQLVVASIRPSVSGDFRMFFGVLYQSINNTVGVFSGENNEPNNGLTGITTAATKILIPPLALLPCRFVVVSTDCGSWRFSRTGCVLFWSSSK